MVSNSSSNNNSASKSPASRIDFAGIASDILASVQSQRPTPLSAGLYIVALPIGNRGDITINALATLQQADSILCEDTRVTGALLNAYGIKKQLIALHDHNERARVAQIIESLQMGKTFALVSDAGTPLIADPGFRLVRECHNVGINVHPIPGACAPIAALSCAGIPSDRFMFCGFLPPKSAARQTILRELAPIQATLVFCESPHRANKLLADMVLAMPERNQSVTALARELTKFYEEIRRGTLSELAAFYADQPSLRGEVIVMIAKGEP